MTECHDTRSFRFDFIESALQHFWNFMTRLVFDLFPIIHLCRTIREVYKKKMK